MLRGFVDAELAFRISLSTAAFSTNQIESDPMINTGAIPPRNRSLQSSQADDQRRRIRGWKQRAIAGDTVSNPTHTYTYPLINAIAGAITGTDNRGENGKYLIHFVLLISTRYGETNICNRAI